MKLAVSGLVVGPIQSNCYIVWDKDTNRGAVVDPGGDLEKIRGAVDAAGCSVEWVLLTHGHFDHVFYAQDVSRLYSAKIAIHPADAALMNDTLDIAECFYDLGEYKPAEPDKLLSDGDVIEIGGLQIRVMHTPGHSPGGVCYDCGTVVFTGDTLFAGSVGRTDFPGGSMQQLVSSIKNKLFVLDDSVIVLPGHGPQSTIGEQKRSNPFVQGVI